LNAFGQVRQVAFLELDISIRDRYRGIGSQTVDAPCLRGCKRQAWLEFQDQVVKAAHAIICDGQLPQQRHSILM
jgi:hypothetical protein